MEFTCQREDLLEAVAAVERAVSTKEALPVLSGILIEAGEEGLRLAATDLELGIEGSVQAQVSRPGAAVVEARLFSQLVRRLSGQEVAFRREEENLARIESGRADFDLRTLPAAEFPDIPQVEGEDVLSLQQTLLRTMIRQTAFAAAQEDARLFLTGVLLEIEGGELRMVATDSNRLAFRRAPLPDGGGREMKVILPARALQELARLLTGDDEAAVHATFGSNQAAFQIGGIRVVSRIIEGQFPNYRHVFPEGAPMRVEVERQALLDAVDRVALVTRKGPVVVLVTVEKERLVLNTRDAEVGSAHEVLEAEHEGEEGKTAYQSRFITDVLRALEAEKVRWELNHGDRQGSIRPVDDEDYLYVIMPVRTA